MKTLLIKNGLVIHSDAQRVEDILIQDENVTQIASNIQVSSDTPVIDASGKWVFPGIIDPHTHMGIPIKSGTSADDFANGSRSALHGGVTTILDFTVLGNDQSLIESLEERKRLAAESLCDVGLHINISRFDEAILAEIPRLISLGFNSFKTFTTYKEAGMMLTYEQIEAVASVIGKHDGLLMVHSEDDGVISAASEPYKCSGKTESRYHSLSRPAEAEVAAIRKLGEISERTNCSIYIVHLNTAAGLAVAAEFSRLKVETCPHYLMLTESVYEREDGRMFVASPPLRSKSDQDALWRGIVDGHIHTIGSDHCPFCLADKQSNIPFQDIPNGMGGVETLFPILLAQFVKRGLDLSLLTTLTSRNAAQIFDLDPIKGSLKQGAHADLIIVDPKATMLDWEAKLDTQLDWNAYAGHPALFPETVIRRGEIVIVNGQVQAPAHGKLLRSRSSGKK